MHDQAAMLRKLVESKHSFNQQAIFENIPELNFNDPKTRVIAITSGKGGVGKTNLTVNLAISLSMIGKKVLIIDADLGMANVDVVLGATAKYNLMHLIRDDITIQDVLAAGPFGVKFISGGSDIEQLASLSEVDRKKIMEKLYECDKFADIILVDTGAGLGHNVLDFLVAADEVVLVTTPEPTAMTDAYAVMKAYSIYSVQRNIKLVVNRVYDEYEGKDVILKLVKTAKRFLDLDVEVLGEIYEDRNMVNAVKGQKPLMISYPNTISAKCIRAISISLLHGGNITITRGWKNFLRKFIVFPR